MDLNLSPLLYTREYFDALQPLLLLLKTRRKKVSVEVWLTIVHHQKEEIIHNPYRYLGSKLSLRKEMIQTVENLFHDFLKRELFVQTVNTIS